MLSIGRIQMLSRRSQFCIFTCTDKLRNIGPLVTVAVPTGLYEIPVREIKPLKDRFCRWPLWFSTFQHSHDNQMVTTKLAKGR